MKRFMEKLSKRDRWIIGIILLIIYAGSAKWPYPLSFYGGIFLAIVFICFLIFSFIYKVPDKAAEERARIAATKLAVAEERRLKQEEFDRTHGKFLTKIVGVTFKNDDGSSRQKYLKEAFANDSIGTVDFEVFEYGGEPAVHVLFEGMCVGNLPKTVVNEFLQIKDRINSANLFVNRFHPDNDDEFNHKPETIYRADLYVTYRLSDADDT